MNNWPEANAKFKFLLNENPDHWQYWKDYISSCIKIAKSNWQPQDDGNNCETDYTIDMASEFIDQTISVCSTQMIQQNQIIGKTSSYCYNMQ